MPILVEIDRVIIDGTFTNCVCIFTIYLLLQKRRTPSLNKIKFDLSRTACAKFD